MKRNISFLLALFAAATLLAGERTPIWPEGRIPDFRPAQIAATTKEAKADGFKAEDHRMPYLDWYAAPAAPNGACMILISGGSYACCCDWSWIDYCAQRLTAAGFQCVSLVYRTPRPEGLEIYRSGWQDGQRAVRIVRREAARRGYDAERIGALGFSAGSHLTVMLATSALTRAYPAVDALDETPCHLAWAVPVYVAYALTDGLTGPNTRDGDASDATLNPSFRFDAKTCPMCFLHGGIDLYSPNGSTRIYRRLREMKIPAELHLFADRNHGFMGHREGAPDAAGYDNWFARVLEFLRQMNFDGKLGPETPQPPFSGAYTERRVLAEIWPKGRMPSVQTNQTYAPTVEWFLPKNRKTRAIQVVFPGGGYSGCCLTGEGQDVAERCNARGMTAVVVHYRTPRPVGLAKHTTAWQDAQRAIRTVRRDAASFGLDPDRIGVMGFSAGGHLTLMAATSARHHAYWPVDDTDKISCSVQWACPIYPAYALTDGSDKPNANGGNLDASVPVSEFSFDRDTPPMCFVHGDADGWASMNSVKIWEKLRRMGIQSDLHTLAKRGHCFYFKASAETGSATWFDRIWEFLNHKGFVKDACGAALKPAADSGTTFARDALAPFVERGELPGAIAVYHKDGREETCCIGYADVAAKRKITLDDPYMQCSQTKGFCGVTIAKLVEEGKISLDDPVSKYLPEFANLSVKTDVTNGTYRVIPAKNTLTVRMCLNHTGGFGFELGNFSAMGGWSRRMPLRSVAATAAASPLLFEPGTRVQYSNVGIDIGAAVVEKVTGKRWETYLKETVLDPLGMTSSGFWPTESQLAHKIELYRVKAGSPAVWELQNSSMQRPYGDDRVFSSAGAGLWTTARDQLKFYKMLMNLGLGENGVRILKEETVKSILATSTRPATLSDPNYSLGLRAPLRDSENEWFGHGGAWGTNCMVNWHKRQLKLWVVQLTGGPRPWDAARVKAEQAFFASKIDNSGADAYTGRMK